MKFVFNGKFRFFFMNFKSALPVFIRYILK